MKLEMRRVLTVALWVLVFSGLASAGHLTYFTANFSGAQEVPPNASTATGFGRVILDSNTNTVRISFFFSGLGSNVTAGHIHSPGAPGVNAGVIINLNPPTGVTSGSVLGILATPSAQQIADLKAGLWYFNIHTTGFPGGEIRGQVLVDSPHIAYIDNNQEVPANASAGRGSGAVSLNASGTQAIVTFGVNGLGTNATAAHIHSGRSGVNGPIICTLPSAAATAFTGEAICTFTPTQAADLRRGQMYINIHSTTFPGGEIRGQIQRRSSTVLDFDGDGKTDGIVARNNVSGNSINWYILNSSNFTLTAFAFGQSAQFNPTRLVAGDYDGDGRDDVAIWGSAVQATFFILQSTTGTIRSEPFGTTGDDPRVVEDYDGDGRADLAVFRTSNNVWYFKGSANNPAGNISSRVWGDVFANPGDYDGDGRGDFMNQVGGQWWTLRSSDGGHQIAYIGDGGSFGVPGDYDGDGKTDVAITRTESGNLVWYYVSTLNPTQNVFLTRRPWGPSSGAFRAQGDYDGDGKTDPAVWISGAQGNFWAVVRDNYQHISFPWGTTNDFPVAGYNNR